MTCIRRLATKLDKDVIKCLKYLNFIQQILVGEQNVEGLKLGLWVLSSIIAQGLNSRVHDFGIARENLVW